MANSTTNSQSNGQMEFSWIERRADGLLLSLAVGFALTVIAVLVFHGGVLRNSIVLGCGAATSLAFGLLASARLGRGVAGGMFMSPVVRGMFIASLILATTGGLWVGFFWKPS
jgi:hypothetical protein